jgi:HSP20 family protein
MLWTDLERFGSYIDPWRSFERMNRAGDGLLQSAAEFPAVNVWTDGDSAVVTAELPGIDPKAVEISVMGKAVTLRASRDPEETNDGESYHRRERWYGQFSRTIDLPYTIDAAKVDAKFNRGVLHLALPRAEEEKPIKIQIRTV